MYSIGLIFVLICISMILAVHIAIMLENTMYVWKGLASMMKLMLEIVFSFSKMTIGWDEAWVKVNTEKYFSTKK